MLTFEKRVLCVVIDVKSLSRITLSNLQPKTGYSQ